MTRATLLSHAIAGAVLCGATTHLAIFALRAGAPVHRLRRFARLALGAYAMQLALGLTLYPAYRTGVRSDLDHAAPWLAQLFEAKEHLAALGLAAGLAAFLILRRHDVRAEDVPLTRVFALITCVFAWAPALTGLLTVTYRSVQ